jgi:flagellar FliJ protein
MKKPTQLELIRDLSQSREHNLATEVGELQRLKSSADLDLNRLDSYLCEYTLGDSHSSSNAPRRVTQVANERRFIKRLNSAVEQQRARAQQFSERVNLKIQSWQRERAQLDALQRTMDQRRDAEEKVSARHEQVEADTQMGHRMALKSKSNEF